MNHMRPHLLSILLISALSIILYINTLENGFTYDDYGTVAGNPFISNFHNLNLLFKKDYFTISDETTYRPVVTFSYFVDYKLYGEKPWGYHLTNLLLHLLNGVLVYIFLALLTQSSIRQQSFLLLPALLFVSHPVLTEAINAIAFREDLLCFFFYMASFNLYLFIKSSTGLRPINWFLYVVSLISYSLALFSKEMALTFPLIIYCYEWVCLRKEKINLKSLLLNPLNIGYIGVTMLYSYIRFYSFKNSAEIDLPQWSLIERLLTIPWLIISYFKHIIFPIILSADYEIVPIQSLYSISFVIPLIIVISILFFSVKNKKVIFGIVFFCVALLPVLNIAPISRTFAERYLYIPIVGLIIATESIFSTIDYLKRYLLIILYFLIILYSFGTIKRNSVWREQRSLWFDTVKKMPNSSIAHTNLGLVYYREGRLDDATRELKTAIQLKPYVAEKHYALGQVYHKKQRIMDAIDEFNLAIAYKPNDKRYHTSRGIAYFDLGKLENARQSFETAYRIDNTDLKAIQNLNAVNMLLNNKQNKQH